MNLKEFLDPEERKQKMLQRHQDSVDQKQTQLAKFKQRRDEMRRKTKQSIDKNREASYNDLERMKEKRS